jgi:uncharacterized protein (TIGR00251 family)
MTLHVWIVPGASSSGFAGVHGDKLKVRVTSPPEGGRANDELAGLLEDALGFRLTMIRGISARHKVFELPVSDPEPVERKLGLAV